MPRYSHSDFFRRCVAPSGMRSLPYATPPLCLLSCQVSPVKMSIREKAKRALLRYTAAAIKARVRVCKCLALSAGG